MKIIKVNKIENTKFYYNKLIRRTMTSGVFYLKNQVIYFNLNCVLHHIVLRLSP